MKKILFNPLILIAALVIFISSCEKDKDVPATPAPTPTPTPTPTPVPTEPTVPVLTTATATEITENKAVFGGNISADGGATVTERGICWSRTSSPTTSNFKTVLGSGTGSFSSTVVGLSPNKTYYVRAYAKNSVGIAYGNQITLTTAQIPGPTVTDIDGNVYHTVTIGNQVWMVENLKTTRYRNGQAISLLGNTSAWTSIVNTGGYCYYNNDTGYIRDYGMLYNWYAAVDSRGVCPTGWRVPQLSVSPNDIGTLQSIVVPPTTPKLKEAGTEHWLYTSPEVTNEFGYTALPGGKRSEYGDFSGGQGQTGYFWTSSDDGFGSVYSRAYYFSYTGIGNIVVDAYNRKNGYSIRCIKE